MDNSFNPAQFQRRLAELQAKRKKKHTFAVVADPGTVGLQAIVRSTGAISFHIHYHCNGSRPVLKIGDFPGTTIEQARALARTVKKLGEAGIDPQEGLHARLIRELTERGTDWRP